MSPAAPPPQSIDQLLDHADWLRRLAAQLVAGRDGDQDALQETWVAAVRHPPPPDQERDARPWLAQVLRNFIRRAGRGGRSRRAREQAFQDLVAPAAPSPEALLERAELQRRLVELVLALAEPYRSTVLLRYYEGLSAAEIARLSGAPPGTVRWRLKQGLSRLRGALDDAHDGQRQVWLLLLSPLPAESFAPSPWWKGGLTLAMTASSKKLAGFILVLLLLLGGGLLWRRSAAPPSSAGPAASASRPAGGRPLPQFIPALSAPGGEISRDDSRAGSVEGQVLSALDGSGLAGAELSFSFGESSLPARTDVKGRFRFSPGDPGVYLLARVSAPGHFAFSPEWGDSPISFVLRAGERISGVRLALRSARTCRGQVQDGLGKPVAGVPVRIWTTRRLPDGATTTPVSDGQGSFDFPGLEGSMLEAYQDGQVAREQVTFAVIQDCAIRLRLRPVGPVEDRSIAGKVIDPDGQPVAGVAVDAWTNPVLHPTVRRMFARALTDAGGQFQLGPLDPQEYDVTVTQAGREVAARDDVPAGTSDLVLQLARNGSLRGQASDAADGVPVVSFSVVMWKRDPDGGFGPWATFTRYDGQGLFELDGLPEGSYRVMVVSEGRTPSDEQVARVAAGGEAPLLRFSLKQGNRIFGKVSDRQSQAPIAGAHVALEGRAGVASTLPLRAEILTGAEGEFEIKGVPSGRLSLLVTAGGHHGRLKGGLEIEPGRDLGPVTVELTPTREGEAPRIELVGIGAAVALKDATVILGALSPDGGAAKAGLQTGDAILAIDGMSIRDLGGLGGAVNRIRGAEGTVVVFRIRRAVDGREQDVRVTRYLVRGP